MGEERPTSKPARRAKKSLADRPELLLLLTKRARDGSVTAIKTLLEELEKEGAPDGDQFADLDNVTPFRKP